VNTIKFQLNGRPVEISDLDPSTTLLQYLRTHANLPGSKEGCAEGDCGACTVALLDAHDPGGPTFRSINACILLLPLLHGRSVYTIEALAEGEALHPAQAAVVKTLGSQCGYCTPGVVMTLFEATYRGDLDQPWKIADQLSGNLCRCTGYRPIRDAADQVAGSHPSDRFAEALLEQIEPIESLTYEVDGRWAHVPTSYKALFALLEAHPNARIVAGATDLGLDVTQKGQRFECMISLHGLPLLRGVVQRETGWDIGATTRLSELEAAVEEGLVPVARMLRYFGARQIKNGGTLGGNLCNASPIGDMAPALLSLGASVVLRGPEGERTLPLSAFFTGYRQTALKPLELMVRVHVPNPHPEARMAAYKVSKRRELDISAVSCGLYVLEQAGVVVEARFGFGGMAATPARAKAAEAAVLGKPWTEASALAAGAALSTDFTPMSDHRGSAWYRSKVAANLLLGFWHETQGTAVPSLPAFPSGTVLNPEVAR
jgi:xanthine dehydrogenase small subunit